MLAAENFFPAQKKTFLEKNFFSEVISDSAQFWFSIFDATFALFCGFLWRVVSSVGKKYIDKIVFQQCLELFTMYSTGPCHLCTINIWYIIQSCLQFHWNFMFSLTNDLMTPISGRPKDILYSQVNLSYSKILISIY